MPADTSVIAVHSGQNGAPQISGQVSGYSGLAMLAACLVNGFGSQTVTISITSGVATVTYPSAHTLEAGVSVQTIAGATPSGLNGRKKILTTPSSTTATFDATGIADGSATGTITASFSPAGWTQPYSGTGLAVFQNNSSSGTGSYYRFDEASTAQFLGLNGYESMTAASTGVNPCTTYYVVKSQTSDSVTRAWALFADSRTCHLLVATGGGNYQMFKWGDYAPMVTPELWAWTVNAAYTNAAGAYNNARCINQESYVSAVSDISTGVGQTSYTDSIGNCCETSSRSLTGTPGATSLVRSMGAYITGYRAGNGYAGSNVNVNCSFHMSGAFPPTNFVGQPHLAAYPMGRGAQILFSNIVLADGWYQGFNYRGYVRGQYYIPQRINGAISNRYTQAGAGPLAGRTLMLMNGIGNNCGLGNDVPTCAFDITGPW